jgi:hypothetical protein
VCGAVLALVASEPVLAQVYKCTDANGKTGYSNLACPQGAKVSTPAPRPNSMDTSGMRRENQLELARNKEEQQRMLMAMGSGAGSSVSECPSDIDIKNMETAASSITKGQLEREFLQDEVRRARQCRAGQGSYTKKDWAESRQAQDDQSRLSSRDRANARARAEAMHSAADPVERQHIHERRVALEAARAQRQHHAAGQLASCDGAGCWGNDGARHHRSGSVYLGPKGACRAGGTPMHC